MSSTLRLAVIGVGSLGQHHARILSDTPGVELVGVVDADPARAAEIAAKFNTTPYSSPDDLPPVDGVSIAAPTTLHAALSVPFLKRGIGVLCEKPMAATVEECEAILRARDAGKAVLLAGHIEHFNPGLRAITPFVQNPGFLEIHRLGVFTGRSLDVDVVLDLMIHDIEIVQSLVGQPIERVDAVGVAALTDHVDLANARLTFRGGCVANLTASRISKDKIRKLRVFQPAAYFSVDYGEQAVEYYKVAEGPQGKAIQKVDLPVEKREPLREELDHFGSLLRGEVEPLVSGDAALEAVRVARQILACMGKTQG